ncbi:hypothetical protein M0805_000719 [Coniferiporia weirii]|nr:hypothetical protein M0805_000719 [Coniferiporia weirii]
MPPAAKRDADTSDETGLELRRVRIRELELKRARGEISCAECRRLKLKCDKKVPCSSCRRRGCQQICPTGVNGAAGQGAHHVISEPPALRLPSDPARVYDKLTAMSERIRALEDALHIETSTGLRSRPHALLAPELLAIKQGIDTYEIADSENKEKDEGEEELMSAFGTLSITDGHTMRFLGATATEQLLLMEVFEKSQTTQAVEGTGSMPEIEQASAMWPFAPMCLPANLLAAQIIVQLPPIERAQALYEAYFTNLAWFLGPVSREQITEELMPVFYPRRRLLEPSALRPEQLHDLSLLLAVFACGAVADLTLSPQNTEATRYQQLARAALGLKNVFDGGSLAACQAIFILGSFETYSCRRPSQEVTWKMMSLGVSIAASIGLHRDPARWKLDPKIVDRRRRCFWEMFLIDIWKSLGTGRPTLFSLNVIDCELPIDRGTSVEDDGTVVQSVWRWRYRFARDVLTLVVDKLCSARPAKYSEILELDRKVRDFDTHPYVGRNRPMRGPGIDADFYRLHPLVTVWYKEMTLFYIHRNFFARAILNFPNDPMRSPFVPSFLSTYRSASYLLRIIREAYDEFALVLFRMWPMWANGLSAAVILASVVSRAPTVSFAASAFNELEKAMELFEAASSHPVVQHGLPLLQRLLDKARAALLSSRTLQLSQPPPGGTGSAANDGAENRDLQNAALARKDSVGLEQSDLLIMRGVTRLVQHTSTPAPKSMPSAYEEVQAAYPAMVEEYLCSSAQASVAAESPTPTTSSGPSASPSSSSATSPEDTTGLSPKSAARASSESSHGKGVEVKRGPMGNAIMAHLSPEGLVVHNKTNSNDSGSLTSNSWMMQSPNTAADPVGPQAQSGHSAPYTPSQDYMPGSVYLKSPDVARAWLARVEQDRAAVIAAQFAAEQQYTGQQPRPEEQPQPRPMGPMPVPPQQQQQQQQYQPWPWPPTASMMSTMHGPAEQTPPQAFSFADVTGGMDFNQDPSTHFDPLMYAPGGPASVSAADVDAFMSYPVSFTPIIDNNSAFPSESLVSAETWADLVQQAGLMDSGPIPEGWEDLNFS